MFTFKDMASILPLVTNDDSEAQDGHDRDPVMLRGPHGIGKSAIVYQFAESVGLPVIERRASQMTEGDLLGLPLVAQSAETMVTSWAATDWFDEACKKAVVLFLDEVDRASQEVRQGTFQLTDSRTINGRTLHPGTIIFAACNSGTHNQAQSYAVAELDPAELDRYTVFDVEPSIDEWLEWLVSKEVPSSVINFLSNNHSAIEHKGMFNPNEKYPSRRSWYRLITSLTGSGLLDNPAEHTTIIRAVATGYLGQESAREFAAYLKNIKPLQLKEILDGSVLDNVDSLEASEINACIAEAAALKILGENPKAFTKENLENLAKFSAKIPAELRRSIWLQFDKAGIDLDTKTLNGPVRDFASARMTAESDTSTYKKGDNVRISEVFAQEIRAQQAALNNDA